MANKPVVKFRQVGQGSKLPTKASDGAAAWDCYAAQDILIYSTTHTTAKVKLGFSVAIPEGYVGLLTLRSSTGANTPIRLANQVGVIDSDYRGEVVACIEVKHSFDYTSYQSNVGIYGGTCINIGERLFQLTIVPAPDLLEEVVTDMTDKEWESSTKRGAGGFGSTGN